MRIDILTLFPETLGDVLSESILGRAQERGYIHIDTHQIRDYTANKQNQTDDYPYGGGRGAVMTADPLYRCWEAVCDEAAGPVHTIYMSPCGHTFKQADAIRLSKMENIIIVCGHYEGIDQRFIDECVDEEISLGDFVLTGGDTNDTPGGALRKLGDQVKLIHAHEVDGKRDNHSAPYDFDKPMDWNDIADALREINYDGTLNFEIGGYYYNRFPDELIPAALAHVAAIGKYMIARIKA